MRTLSKLLGSLWGKEEGMAGPAAAVVFCSLAIVGSSFAFAVVNGGNLGAQQVSETLMASLDGVLGTLQLGGPVSVIDVNDDGVIDGNDHIVLDLRNVPNGRPVLVDPAASSDSLIINYVDLQGRVPGVAYAVTKINGDGDDFLESGELFELTVSPPAGSTLDANETFSLEVIPPGGAPLTVERTMAPANDRVTALH